MALTTNKYAHSVACSEILRHCLQDLYWLRAAAHDLKASFATGSQHAANLQLRRAEDEEAPRWQNSS